MLNKLPFVCKLGVNLSKKAVLTPLSSFFHSSAISNAWSSKDRTPIAHVDQNNVVFPPQSPDEEPRKAFVCHQKCNIKYSPTKMMYVSWMIRGMPVDEAIRQLRFVLKKGATDVIQVLEEAKELAVKEHNVEFPSNMWVSESFVGKGVTVKGLRRHARSRPGEITYRYCHYFVKLEEGTPPAIYYRHDMNREPHELLEKWLSGMRKRKIINSL